MKQKTVIAEFIGTFALIFIGAGSIIVNHYSQGAVGLVGIALAHGLTIAVMVSATAAISGGHLNPAVTIALFCTQKIDAQNALRYIAAQCLGAVTAAAALRLCLPYESIMSVHVGTPMLGGGVTVIQGLLTEIFLTFVLMFVIYGTAVDRRAPQVGGLYIGLAVTLDIFMGGPITGAAMNPARHLGPALLGGGLQNIWLYWVGPIIGAVLAAVCYHKFLTD